MLSSQFMYVKRFENGIPSALKFCKRQIQRGNMKARTTLLIVLIAAVFVLATISMGFQGETPPVKTLQPVIIRHIGWGWLLISGLIGFLLGRITNFRRRRRGGEEDTRRNRAA
jgi:hypothetical protein